MRKKDEVRKDMEQEPEVKTDLLEKDQTVKGLNRLTVIESTAKQTDPDQKMDSDFGAMRQVFLRRKHEYAKGIQFLGTQNLVQIIEWLGPDFYALTQGDPITINNQVIKFERGDASVWHPEEFLLIIHDKIGNCYHAVRNGSWIIYDDDMGYNIMSDEKLNEMYRKVYLDVF